MSRVAQIRELLCDEAGVRFSDAQLQNYINQAEALHAYIPAGVRENCTSSKKIDELENIVVQEFILFRVAIIDRDLKKARIHLNVMQGLFKMEGEYPETCISDNWISRYLLCNSYTGGDLSPEAEKHNENFRSALAEAIAGEESKIKNAGNYCTCGHPNIDHDLWGGGACQVCKCVSFEFWKNQPGREEIPPSSCFPLTIQDIVNRRAQALKAEEKGKNHGQDQTANCAGKPKGGPQ